jgi:hypothetical protein
LILSAGALLALGQAGFYNHSRSNFACIQFKSKGPEGLLKNSSGLFHFLPTKKQGSKWPKMR